MLKYGIWMASALVFACSGEKLELGVQGGQGGGIESGGSATTTGGASSSGGTASGGKTSTGGTTSLGGVTATGGTNATGASAGVAGASAGKGGFIAPTAFEELTLVTYDGFPSPPPENAECEPGKYPNTYSIAGSVETPKTQGYELTWNLCDDLESFGTKIQRGGAYLDDSEFAAVQAALAKLGPANGECAADKDLITLDLLTNDRLLALQDDMSGCSDGPREGRTFVSGMDPLVNVISRFVYARRTPNKLTLTQLGGFEPPNDPDSECDTSTYENTFVADFSSLQLTWDECLTNDASNLARKYQGSRTLSRNQIAELTSAYYALDQVSGGSCGADKDVILLEAETQLETIKYADAFYSCLPSLSDRLFVSNIEVFVKQVASLVPPLP